MAIDGHVFPLVSVVTHTVILRTCIDEKGEVGVHSMKGKVKANSSQCEGVSGVRSQVSGLS